MRGLVLKELWLAMYGYKFVLSFVLAFAVLPFFLYVGAERYKTEHAEYLHATRTSLDDFRHQGAKATHSAAHFGLAITKPPSPLVAFSSGVHDMLGIRAEINPHRAPQPRGSLAERTPLLLLFGNIDYAVAIQVIFGLFALVLSFDLVAGEREDGTLALVLANAVPRSQLLVAKLVGGSLALLVPVVAATCLGLLFFTPLLGIHLSADEGWRLLMIVALSLVYLVMMFLLGLLASTLSRRRITSLITLLVVWVVLIFIVPRSAASLAQQLAPIPANEEIDRQLREITRAETKKAEERTKAYLAAHPELDRRSIPAIFFTDNRRTMDEAVEEQAERVEQVVAAAKERQVSLATGLARLSPTTAYLLAVTDLAGTGVDRHERFVQQLDDYRRRFRGHFDDLERAGVERLESYEDVPQFSYREATIAEVLPGTLIDATILLGMALLLFASAWTAFLRYDVR